LELEVTPRKEQQEAGAVRGEPLSIEPMPVPCAVARVG